MNASNFEQGLNISSAHAQTLRSCPPRAPGLAERRGGGKVVGSVAADDRSDGIRLARSDFVFVI